MKTIIVGIGNPLLTDDSVGIKAVRILARRFENRGDVETREFCAGGLRLMEELQGYERAIIIDAIVTGGRSGSVYRLKPSDLVQTRNTCSTHDGSLQEAFELGQKVGLSLPREITIWAIEAGDVSTYSEDLTENVEQAMAGVVDAVVRQLENQLRIYAREGREPARGGRNDENRSLFL